MIFESCIWWSGCEEFLADFVLLDCVRVECVVLTGITLVGRIRADALFEYFSS
jgi:hypothetical protein